MFCENCGTRVEDGQPFCPNCGNKMPVPEAPAAPANPADPAPAANANPAYIPPVAPAKAPSNNALLGKFNDMSVMEKIVFLCTGGLLVICFLFSLLKTLHTGYAAYHLARSSPFLSTVITILFTLSITFFVLDYFDKFSFKWLWFFIAGAAATIFLFFIIGWIASGVMLSVGGWLLLFLLCNLVAATVLLLIQKLKKK